MILPIHVYALYENYKKSCDKFTQKRKRSAVLRKKVLSKNEKTLILSCPSFLFLSVFLTVGNIDVSTITHSRFSHKI